MSNNKIKLFSQHDLSKIVKVDKTALYGEPYMVTESTSRRGGITRNFYDENGRQYLQISNNGHGNPKDSRYGIHGEHAHDYIYDSEGNLISRESRELNDNERERNGDIL